MSEVLTIELKDTATGPPSPPPAPQFAPPPAPGQTATVPSPAASPARTGAPVAPVMPPVPAAQAPLTVTPAFPASAYSAPQRVWIVSPLPLPVRIEGGGFGSGGSPRPAATPNPLASGLGTAAKIAGAAGASNVATGFSSAAGLAGAAGPAAAVIAGLLAVKEIGRIAADGVRSASDFAAGVAKLDAGALVDAYAGMVKTIPLVGEAAGEVVLGFRKVVSGLAETADRLAGYNGQLAVAQAQADVRQILGDIRRAQQLGPGLARFTDAKSRLDQSSQDLLAKAAKQILPMVTQILEFLKVLVDNVNPERTSGILKGAFDGAFLGIGLDQTSIGFIKGVLSQILGVGTITAKNTKPKDEEFKNNDLLKQLTVTTTFPGPLPPQAGPSFRPQFPFANP